MQNTSKLWLKSTSSQFTKCFGTYPCTSGPYDVYWDYVNHASRGQKRKKPVMLTPKYGTAASMERRTYAMIQRGIKETGSGTSYSYSEWAPQNLVNLDSFIDEGKLLTLTELQPLIANKIREEIMSSKSQLGVDLVELRKTRVMLVNAAISLLHGWRDLRSGYLPFAELVKALRKEGFKSVVGQKWLEFIYGWSPTVSGAFDTAEVLMQHLQQGSTVLGKVKARTDKRKLITTVFSRTDHWCEVRAKGQYQYTISDPKLLRLSQLGFVNPLAIAWELLPWSFVLDWFVDVGGYINRMDYALGIKDVYWQYTCRRQTKSSATYTGYLQKFREPSYSSAVMCRTNEARQVMWLLTPSKG